MVKNHDHKPWDKIPPEEWGASYEEGFAQPLSNKFAAEKPLTVDQIDLIEQVWDQLRVG